MGMTGNTLYRGDNLDVLRRHVQDESVDLVYLDPPFKSNQDYNVLFEEQDGARSEAQVRAFEDTWRWDEGAARAYQATLEDGPQLGPSGARAATALRALRDLTGETDMLAYLSMMAPRLVELHRALKFTGSIYLHCDPTASHYLKALMDAVFGGRNFRREIIWRSGWVSGFKSKAKNWVRNHDVLLYYVRDLDAGWTFNKDLAYRSHEPGYKRRGGGENPLGVAVDDVWDEVGLYSPWIKSFSQEKLGYMTQKPVTLLERIIKVSSNPGDTVLDPFCGCGTTVHAAQALGRGWTGIDITHLAVTLVKHRLQDAFQDTAQYKVVGEPVTLREAEALAAGDPHQFEWWALGLVGARPAEKQKKGADGGSDGRLYFHDEGPKGPTRQVVVSVKSGHTGVAHVRDLRGVIEREKAELGVLITLKEPTQAMRTEAVDAGAYESQWSGRKHPRLQVITIDGLLSGKGADLPVGRAGGNVSFKRATRGAVGRGPQLSLTVDDLAVKEEQAVYEAEAETG